jgi:UDP-N-acetylglucosamine:LPS N-acetylglucosamine transferase
MYDYLDALPLKVGHLVRWNYHLQLRYAPWSYENSYHMMPRIYGLLVWLNRVFALPKLRSWMRRFPPDVVVSNNPLATLAIGGLRQRGKLDVPAVTYITDFGVHPLWIHEGIDLHLAVHPQAAAAAAAQSGGGEVRAPGPLVSERFRSLLPDRPIARNGLGLAPDQRAVLVVAGSWGVGEIEETARLLLGSGRYTPVTVCGRDRKLRRRMEREGLGIVIG